MSEPLHRSETHDVRPFFGAAALENALEGARIRLYVDQPFSDAVSFLVEDNDLARLNVAVRPGLAEEALAASPLPRAELSLVLAATNTFLKRTELIRNASLVDPAPVEISLPPTHLARLGGGPGLAIHLVVALNRERKRVPGSPFAKGHWLAKKSFALRSQNDSGEFKVEPLDREGWIQRGLPPDTLYFVVYEGGMNEPPEPDSRLATVFVHSDVFKKLEVGQKPAATTMTFLAAETAAQILQASCAEWEAETAPQKGSPLATFLRRINRVQHCTLPELRQLAQQPGGGKLRAILHADQKSVRRIVES